MVNLRLKELRVKMKLTQADVSEHLQIARETYTRYESGEREMTYESLILLADMYKVSVDYLLGRGEIDSVVFGTDEVDIIKEYRLLDGRGKNAVKAILASELTHAIKSNKKQ
jgi:transcriptional regulator with XRE-family HTH domain